ncbi:hypothetical protein AC1031_004788 [Aphanomyces cochlioides]|nr:hypothetical protein AC1031_004788 [Aphanomyces cochlioides]
MIVIPSEDIIVGDIVLIEEQIIPGDMVILTGECMADEASLTGEAEVWAVVTRTGFSTNKGELLRQILHPETPPFQIVSDSYRYLVALSIVAGLTSLLRIYDAIKAEKTQADLLISVFDLISTTIPAVLPMILTVGVGFSLTRLRKARIFCIDAQKINIAGHLNCFCFDKTGTLTSEHLIFHGVDPCDGSEITSQPTSQDLDYALASCHGLSVVDGVVTGYALERDMFASTEYMLNASHEILKNNQVVLRYCHRFPFDAALQRSSVVVQAINETGNYRVFVKGSPEAMTEICESASLPSDFECRVQQYASQGYYCMGLATKVVTTDATTTDRAQMESNAKFSGFLLFVNPIKPESSQVFQTLESADIDVRIITADNALTAMHVAREISMRLTTCMLYVDVAPDGSLMYQLLPSSTVLLPVGDLSTLLDLDCCLTVTGSALEIIKQSSSTDLTNLVLKTKIFARIKPQLKTWIVQILMDSESFFVSIVLLLIFRLCVGMTGDGTNDCGALKAAHVGLALSDAEASIVAPFTSRDKAIQDVVTLIREGRCALTASLPSFKFMVMYPMIDTVLVSFINHVEATFTSRQYLFDDLVVVSGISVLMLQTPPAQKLSKSVPPTSLFAPSILWSVGGHFLCFALFSWATLSMAEREPWFCPLPEIASGKLHCYKFHPNEKEGMTAHSYESNIAWLIGT